MKKLLTLATISALVLGGCSKETIHEVQYETKGSHSGTVDSGGDNILKGKSLEDYHVKQPLAWAQGIPVLATVLDNLAKSFPELAGDFLHIFRDRTWYMIPETLNQIPSVQLGVYFSTDQGALQNLKDIWFDSRLMDAMGDQAKATVILHELVMGVRLMSFTDTLDQCIAEADRDLLKPAAENKFSEKQEKCYKLYAAGSDVNHLIQPLPSISLNNTDYPNIRKLVILLLDSSGVVDAKELKLWMAANRFHSYP